MRGDLRQLGFCELAERKRSQGLVIRVVQQGPDQSMDEGDGMNRKLIPSAFMLQVLKLKKQATTPLTH